MYTGSNQLYNTIPPTFSTLSRLLSVLLFVADNLGKVTVLTVSVVTDSCELTFCFKKKTFSKSVLFNKTRNYFQKSKF